MFDLSKQEVLTTLKNHEKLIKRVHEVVNEIGFLNEEYDKLESDKIDFSEDEVYVTAYDSHYDLYDSTSGSFPIDFLFEKEEQHKDWYKKKQELLQKEKQLKEEQQKRNRELAELQRLKEKYEYNDEVSKL